MTNIKVAVMNTSKEITSMLGEVLQDAGFTTASIYTYFFKDDPSKFDEFLEINNPDVIVYDIALPYRENYFLFKELYARPSAKTIPFVLTTTNKEALESFVGKTATYPLVGKPYDLQEIIDAVKKAYSKKVVNANNQFKKFME